MTPPNPKPMTIEQALKELERLTTTIEEANPLDPGLPVLIRTAQDMEQRLLKAIHHELEVNVLAYARLLAVSRDHHVHQKIEDLKTEYPELTSKIEDEVSRIMRAME